MREIKFREWKHQEKKMYHIDLHNEALLSTNKHDVLMQWTGLRDKNDVEIYEGDIVRITAIGTSIGKVIFVNSGKFNVIGYAIELKNRSILYLYNDDELEVVGNIYENKELLND